MYETGEAILFFVVFLSQVLLISWFFPKRRLSRIRYVLENYPPSTHPKLYGKPIEHYERVARNFARLNFAIVVAGLLIIAGLLLGTFATEWDGAIVTPFSTSGEWDAAIVTPFVLVQWIPFAYLEISSGSHYRGMAKVAPPRVRTTELRRRRIVDFISPAMLAAAAFTYVAFVAFILWYNRFGFPWFTASWNIAIVTAGNLAVAVSVAVAVYGRWPNHYQAHQDRLAFMSLLATRALVLVMVAPALIAAQLIVKIFDPEFLEPVIASLWVQAIAALALSFYNYRVEKIDFDVYKKDAVDPRLGASTTIGPARPSV